ncbi:uncharacterized protein EDB91DRAFT_1131796 [Suillus paluster]|uniref:uncharacterized protein n=1 Tax=Suillus paluster TaxID=48578 RepID=UPI001B87CB84|nr:uncharacterized protein EDB91DRAFT_1131796 [Suillus paluster]KAG1740853.1 hypothetical protein EDB91DRAFT_1131796 [Suillus paluster]
MSRHALSAKLIRRWLLAAAVNEICSQMRLTSETCAAICGAVAKPLCTYACTDRIDVVKAGTAARRNEKRMACAR